MKSWSYAVTREGIRDYAKVLGHEEPWYFDRDAAVEMGFRDVVAPPLFAVVFTKWMSPLILDPESGIDYDHMLHGGQEFEFLEPVCAGDTIETVAEPESRYEKRDLTFHVLASTSTNQLGRDVVRGRWTMIVRAA